MPKLHSAHCTLPLHNAHCTLHTTHTKNHTLQTAHCTLHTAGVSYEDVVVPPAVPSPGGCLAPAQSCHCLPLPTGEDSKGVVCTVQCTVHTQVIVYLYLQVRTVGCGVYCTVYSTHSGHCLHLPTGEGRRGNYRKRLCVLCTVERSAKSFFNI